MRLLQLIILVALWFSQQALAEYDLLNGIAAIANDTVITIRDVEMASAQAMDLLRRTYGGASEAYRQKRLDALEDALKQLIERQLILYDFKNMGGVFPENYIDDEINDRIRRRFGDRVTLTKTLQAEGITFEEYKKRTRDEIILAFMERKNVREAIMISPAKIERFYQTNLNRFQLGDQVKLRMIVLSRPSASSADEIQKLAQNIRAKINEGTPFAEMATIYSEGSQRKEGGLWGWVEESKLKKGLSEIAFALELQQPSRAASLARASDDSYWIYQYDDAGHLVRGRHFTDRDAFIEEKVFSGKMTHNELPVLPQEFYLMLVEEKKVAHTRSLQEVRDEIERDFLDQEKRRLQQKWLDRLRSKSFVRYF
jgi:peptidyl-prolyl cis-trans isomerase SurA